MSSPIIHPMPYPEINAVLHELLTGVREILGDHFIGLYLYGSRPVVVSTPLEKWYEQFSPR